MKTLLIDLDGVLYVGDQAVPGAPETLRWLNQQRVPHLFLTNTTSRSRRGLVNKLAALGIETEPSRIYTPPVAACRWLAEHAPGPAALFVPEATRGEFDSLPQLPDDAETGAASVVIGDLSERWDFKTINRAFRLLMAEPRPALVALGMTRYWRAEDGLRLDVAPFVKALEHAASCQAVILGKPSSAFFEAALEQLACRAMDAVMIGDDIVGDVLAAQASGIKGVLVRTGKFRERDLEGEARPDLVLDSIAALPKWWRTNCDVM